MSQLDQMILTFALRCGLKKPQHVKLISKGIASETYQLLDRKQRYIITRFLDKDDTIKPILLTRLIKHYHELGFPVPQLIGTGTIDGSEAVLCEYAKGKVKPDWQIGDYEKLGFLIGNLHLSQKAFSILEPGQSIISHMHQKLQNLDDALPQEFRAVYDELDLLEKVWPQNIPLGTIHGDLWYKNVFFEQNRISAILEYHKPFTDCLIYDLATVMKGIYFSQGCKGQDEKFNAFLKHYEFARPLSEEELYALPTMLHAKILYTILFMLEQASLKKSHRESFLSTAMFNLLKLQESREISFEKISL